MSNDKRISIATDITADDITSLQGFPYNSVIDLRADDTGAARPIGERVLKRLGNFFVDFDQMPTDLREPEAREDILDRVAVQDGKVLVLTEQVGELRNHCEMSHVPSHVIGSTLPTLSVVGGAEVPDDMTDVPDYPRAANYA